MDPVELTRWKIESMQRAQTTGDTENSIVMTGQVASAINELVDVAEFVPRMAAEAAEIITGLADRLRGAAAAMPAESYAGA
jgi:enoyl-[acyl-carrier protein] reductase II